MAWELTQGWHKSEGHLLCLRVSKIALSDAAKLGAESMSSIDHQIKDAQRENIERMAKSGEYPSVRSAQYTWGTSGGTDIVDCEIYYTQDLKYYISFFDTNIEERVFRWVDRSSLMFCEDKAFDVSFTGRELDLIRAMLELPAENLDEYIELEDYHLDIESAEKTATRILVKIEDLVSKGYKP